MKVCMTTILGLDIGVASVGFALISRRADGRQVRILRMGVRVFPEGRTEDKQEPRNLERRTARLRRRQLRRRRQHRRQLGDTLIAAGLLPPFDPTPGSAWHKVMAGDPYCLRKIGLDRPLAPAEVGRALYHLAQTSVRPPIASARGTGYTRGRRINGGIDHE